MVKKKTSISIDEKLWEEFVIFVVKKTGSSRKISQEVENAIKFYMEKDVTSLELSKWFKNKKDKWKTK